MQSTWTSASLIGRTRELQTMRDMFAAELAGTTRTIVVAGEAGIGKSRLVSEFLPSVPSDAVIAVGQSIDLGADAPPYAPVTGLLRALHAEVGTDTIVAAAGHSREGLSVLMPDLDESTSPRDGRRGAEWLYDSVAVMLESLSAIHPLVLVLEDLHWADQATIGLLRYLTRVLEQADILFVLTYRTDDVRRRPLYSWLPELERSKRVSRIDLARLSQDEVRDLANALFDSPLPAGQLGTLYRRSDGVPFLVEELVSFQGFDVAGCFPPSLRGVLLARYDMLSEPTRRITRLLAAGGMRVEHALLEGIYDDDPSKLDTAAAEAIDASVLVVEGTAYRFRHALVREAIHDELLPGERTRFHRLYASALEARGGLEGTTAVAISHHWMAAHDLPAAFSASLTAMAQAHSAYAYETAARMGERALELWHLVPDAAGIAHRTRAELLATTAYAFRNAGESDRAIALVDEAMNEAPTNDPDRIAGLLRDKSSYLANVGLTGSIDLLRQALVVLDGEPASVLRASVLGELAARLMLQGELEEAVSVADAAYAEAETVDSQARMSVAANIRGMSLLSRGDVSRGLADLRRSGELAGDDDSPRLRYWVNLSDAMTKLGRFQEAISLAEQGVEYARLRGVERTKGAILMSNLIEPLFALGHWDQAKELLDRALELNPPLGYSAPLQELKLWSTLWGGDPVAAGRLLQGWRDPLNRQRSIQAQVRLGLAGVAGEIELETGNVLGAWQEVRIIFSAGHQGQPAHDLPVLLVAARVISAIVSGGVDVDWVVDYAPLDAESAEIQLRTLLQRHAEWPTQSAFAAVVDAELGGTPRGTDVALWRRAVDAVAVETAPAVLRAWAGARLAESLALTGDRSGALEESERARSAAESMGAGLIVHRVDVLQRRAGLVSGARVAPRSAVSLTERERQVLALVAHGYGNRQIGEHLFISAKTASVHVSAILRKLGAATRTEAVYLAQQSGEITASANAELAV